MVCDFCRTECSVLHNVSIHQICDSCLKESLDMLEVKWGKPLNSDTYVIELKPKDESLSDWKLYLNGSCFESSGDARKEVQKHRNQYPDKYVYNIVRKRIRRLETPLSID